MIDSKRFMQIALAEDRDFTGPPAPMVPFADWDYYYTKGVIEWEPSTGSLQVIAVKIPIGFVTDLASIPKSVAASSALHISSHSSRLPLLGTAMRSRYC